ncbi:HAD family hydrolase [Ketogulonicigenium vulgare]|uniref:Hydrolase, haloacid delahogenase-like protein family protein n=1 Tax=Ketogulonicigenium vulgare (strain WSH-001) TaxID=759362 RepID=F9YA99_KETVW|nr:HAD family hydrolase [Ketogulonicigenium vulgare]ADO42055.1 Predicted hydrolase (haloacid dehalogenase (HAD) superfamily protein) [Ketogulonicigenium vulgare Y25]AEM40272.1 Hydrolase, haloacid delahogenase-like protein family protein [Ketogulonicigenium vulgare WSH-001]ALJ80471.1 HAD family hydrolase [Ketogulonicigenium vulgare]ANW33298.1 HAD family hydrolase [Ketogulonicigenium vulgare]AOZ53979.1 putative hydrolase (haloacid dehalogenase (HAD) superfamily protein) [Ketogulonicigenium vulga
MPRNDWTIGFDADDTLWENETFFRTTEAQFVEMLGDFADRDHLMNHLMEAETRNLASYGFGIKGFVLSMIESAIQVTEGRVDSRTIGKIVDWGKDMLAHPVDLLPGARAAVEAMAERGDVVLITKGDLLDQERKLALSGLGELFTSVEIVSDKRPETYARIFARHDSHRALMVGNSLKSDVIPAIEAGHWGVHIPFETTWAFEMAEAPVDHPRFRALPQIGHLVGLVDSL